MKFLTLLTVLSTAAASIVLPLDGADTDGTLERRGRAAIDRTDRANAAKAKPDEIYVSRGQRYGTSMPMYIKKTDSRAKGVKPVAPARKSGGRY